jgi:hypothetical protein
LIVIFGGISVSINLTKAARIRVVVGFLAITLGLMDLINPSVSDRWRWLRDWMTSIGGAYGYSILLMCIGAAFILWAVLESRKIEGGEQ